MALKKSLNKLRRWYMCHWTLAGENGAGDAEFRVNRSTGERGVLAAKATIAGSLLSPARKILPRSAFIRSKCRGFVRFVLFLKPSL